MGDDHPAPPENTARVKANPSKHPKNKELVCGNQSITERSVAMQYELTPGGHYKS